MLTGKDFDCGLDMVTGTKFAESVAHVAKCIYLHEQKMRDSFSLVPSENILSPLAKAVLTSDVYARYYFEDDRLWGQWAFPAGQQIGNVQEDIAVPILRKLAKARFVNVRAISGLSNMILTLSAYCKVGATVVIVPAELGGHASTSHVAKRLGLRVEALPRHGDFEVDEDKLTAFLSTEDAALLYVDQANVLFPLNIQRLRRCIQNARSSVCLHVDTSHINGLVFGGAISNPLTDGADSFGGSLHKTFPGPHKAFFATDSEQVNASFRNEAAHLVSHHHGAEIVALAVTLLEFENCGGEAYSKQIVRNAKAFASVLDANRFTVAGADRGFTQTHQVWIGNDEHLEGKAASDRLRQVGLLVNAFGGLPVFRQGGIRVGLNEATKLGLEEQQALKLAELFVAAVTGVDLDRVRSEVCDLRHTFATPKYCFEYTLNAVDENLMRILHHMMSSY